MRAPTPIRAYAYLPVRLVLLLFSFVSINLPSVCDARKLARYVVQSGDSCWSIAERFFGEGKRYDIIHQYNDLGAQPHLLQPGTTLLLPQSARPDAAVSWLHRTVETKPPRSSQWRRARQGMNLWQLFQVSTGNAASAGIAFSDNSRLRMRENALLVIYGSATRSRLRRKHKGRVRVQQGVVRGGLATLDKRATLVVETPTGHVSLRSTESQIGVDKKRNATVAVYKGHADVSAQGSKVRVPKGFGTRIKRGQRPTKPRALPKAPKWIGSSRRAFLTSGAPSSTALRADLRWRAPSTRAGSRLEYRVEVSPSPSFDEVVVDQRTSKDHITLNTLTRGSYWARVSAIDVNGLEGMASPAIRLDVISIISSRRMVVRPNGWFVTGIVQLTLPKSFRKEYGISVNGSPATSGRINVSRAGDHMIRVTGAGDTTAARQKLHIVAVSGTLQVKKTTLDSGASTIATLTIRDEKGRPAYVPGAYIRLRGEAPLPLTIAGAGRYQATISAPSQFAASMLLVEAGWPHGETHRASVFVKHIIHSDHVSRIDHPKSASTTNAQKSRTNKTAANTQQKSTSRVAWVDPDADADGVAIPQDRCPTLPEDLDNFEDGDGCPDLDNDRDGVPDTEDRCPSEKETVNGVDDDDGCPDQGASQARIHAGQVVIDERIYFVSGSDAIDSRSFALLMQVARLIRANPTIRVEVQGHTDNVGDKEMNVDLSQRRAERVVSFLIKHRVPQARLTAKGYGPLKPIVDNESSSNRAKNRRVVFHILN